MCDGPESGLNLIDSLLARGELANYQLAHSARADLCRRLGRTAEARSSYEKAGSCRSGFMGWDKKIRNGRRFSVSAATKG
jgi:predicted RNA polymerase sigma factor